MGLRDRFAAPEGKYPLGNPEGTLRQRVLWKLGFRKIPTPEERMIGFAFVVVGALFVGAGFSALL